MRRVVMLTNTYAPMVGGLERSVATAHEDLNRAGHHCTVMAPSFAGANVSMDGVVRLPSLRNIGRKRFSLALPVLGRVRRWVAATAPDVIHVHQPFLLGGTGMRLARSHQIPLVFTYHTFYERYSHYLPVPAEIAQRWMMAMTTHFANRCSLVIAPTPSVRDILLARGITAPIEVAPSGINVDLYSKASRPMARAHFDLKDGDEVVGHLGRLGREKNIPYLLTAMIRLMLERPSVKWLLVGDGDTLPQVREQLRAAGLLDRLIVPGVLEPEAAAVAYAAMDVFAFASHTDTQGLVLAEAMAAGVPVVALDAPGPRDCVQDQVSGVLLPAQTPSQDFADVLLTLFDDPTRRRALSEAARQHSRLFSRSRCLARLLDAYQRALEPAPAVLRCVI